MPFTHLFASAVAEPLGLTIYHYNDEQNPRVAGGGYSNVDDYAKILRMILRDGVADNGTRVLSDAMIQELGKNQIGSDTFQPLWFLDAAHQAYFSPQYTLGFFVTNPVEYSSEGSPGPEFSDPGYFGATPWLDAGLGYAAIVLIYHDVPTGLDMQTAVRPVIITQLTR
jgi:CubicO group peptidase (beta-lactamase class C family)